MTTLLHEFGGCVGTAFGHFLLGSYNFLVMACGSCVKWPSEVNCKHLPHRICQFASAQMMIRRRGGTGVNFFVLLEIVMRVGTYVHTSPEILRKCLFRALR